MCISSRFFVDVFLLFLRLLLKVFYDLPSSIVLAHRSTSRLIYSSGVETTWATFTEIVCCISSWGLFRSFISSIREEIQTTSQTSSYWDICRSMTFRRTHYIVLCTFGPSQQDVRSVQGYNFRWGLPRRAQSSSSVVPLLLSFIIRWPSFSTCRLYFNVSRLVSSSYWLYYIIRLSMCLSDCLLFDDYDLPSTFSIQLRNYAAPWLF